MINVIFITFFSMIFVWTLLGSLELGLLTFGALLPQKKDTLLANKEQIFKMAVIIPAHNEESGIGRTVQSLKACTGEGLETAVIVIADNCEDRTAEKAHQAGARVFVREDREQRGKGYALQFAFESLLKEEWDAFAVVDADTVVKQNFLEVVRNGFEEGAEAVQASYGVLTPYRSMRTRLRHIALLAFNHLRPMGRNRLGFSAGMLGNGFAVRKKTLEEVPFSATSITEDVEYHLRLVEKGIKVFFLRNTKVLSEMPSERKAANVQILRWEGGRMRLVMEWGPRLLSRVLHGQTRFLEPFLDLLLPPLAYLMILLTVLALAPWAFFKISAGVGFLILFLHVVAAIWIGGEKKDFVGLFYAPVYIGGGLIRLPRVFLSAGKRSSWIRTPRGFKEK